MKYFRIPTHRELYAHALLVSFYFILLGTLSGVLSAFIHGTTDRLNGENLKFIISLGVFSFFFIPFLYEHFHKELRQWFSIYFVLIFILRFFFF